MINKRGLLLCILFLGISLYGCQTTKGTVKGMAAVATAVGATAKGVSEGVVKDTKNTYNFIMALDAWIKKNLW